MIGGHQEKGRRGGTREYCKHCCPGKSLRIRCENNMETENTRVKYLQDKLENGLLKNIPNSKNKRRQNKPSAQHIKYQL